MISLFLVFLTLFLLINLQFTKNFFHPTVIFKMVWLFSGLVLLFYKDRWSVTLSLTTIFLFLVGFLAFDMGFIVFYLIKNTIKKDYKQKNNSRTISVLKNSRLLLLVLVVLAFSGYLLFDIIRLVGGFTNFFSESFFTNYRSIKYDGTDSTNIQQFLFKGLEVIGIATFIFFLREKDKIVFRKYIYIIVMVITFGIQLLTTGRMILLAIIVQISLIWLIHVMKNGKTINFRNQVKYVRRLLYTFMAFMFVFYLYGKFAVDKISESDPFHSIAIYISASLPAFDQIWPLQQNTSEYFGQHILGPIYNIMNKLFGVEFSTADNSITKPFVKGDGGFSTNVYTLYHEQILDFGVWIIPFVMIGIGFFMAYLKYKSDSENIIGFWTAVYSVFMFKLVISFFKDTFFSSSTFTFLTLILLFLIFKTKLFNNKKYNGKPDRLRKQDPHESVS